MLHALFPEKLPGITTWAEPKKAVYLQENLSGERVQIAAFDPSLPGPGNQMVMTHDGFASLGIPALKRCMESGSAWITIDEIGYLEAGNEAYHQALRSLLDRKQVAMVVRKEDLPFLRELRSREDVYLIDLDKAPCKVGCVIMASGLGKRFGGNKLMADFRGEPMILQALKASESLKDHRVVVTRHADVAKLCREQGVQVVLHDLPHRSDTVRLGLKAVDDVDACLFLPADQPLLRPETVEKLVSHWENNPQRMVRPACEGTPGSPVVFPRWTFPQLRNLPEGKGGGWVMNRHPDCVDLVPIDDPHELMDADTPQTLDMLQRGIF